jgi:hypothetical protein
MAVPKFGGYGYERGATMSRHAQSLGQFAGMDLPYLGGAFGGGGSGAANRFGSMAGYSRYGPGGGHEMDLRATGYSPGGVVPHFPSYGAPTPGHVEGVNPLQWQGQARTGPVFGGTKPVSKATRRAGQAARSQLWQQALGALRPEPQVPQAPSAQLALGPGPAPSQPAIGAAPTARPWPGTNARPHPGPPPQPLSAPGPFAGELGPATARPGSPAPTARPMGPVIETTAQQQMPWDVPQIGGPVPSTRSPRSRRASFGVNDPNQGSLF